MSNIIHRGKKFRHRAHKGTTTKHVLKAMEDATKATMAWLKMLPSRDNAAFDMVRRFVVALGDVKYFDELRTDMFPDVIASLGEVTAMHSEPWPTEGDPLGDEFKRVRNLFATKFGISAYVEIVCGILDNPQAVNEQNVNEKPFNILNAPFVLAAMRRRLIAEGHDPDEQATPDDDMKELIAVAAKHSSARGNFETRKILNQVAGVGIARKVPASKIADAIDALALEDDEESESESEEAFG